MRQAAEKVWYAVHVSSGRPEIGEPPAKLIEAKYSKEELCLCDRCAAYNDGTLTALRWVLGYDWDSLVDI